KAGGIFLVNEYHPIRRMWSDSETTLPSHRYFDRGPHSYQTDEGLPAYEYHWTVADHIQAVLDAGCTIGKVDEFGEDLDEMTPSALRTLPTYLLIAGRKSGAG
ncbi:MAG: hypothetical protein H3C34_05440, partial [Caldilineaceae bacterium]|nr:hypothetical protein [Caldilineaceae bacterium]